MKPHMPCTPPPGGVEEEHIYTSGCGLEELLGFIDVLSLFKLKSSEEVLQDHNQMCIYVLLLLLPGGGVHGMCWFHAAKKAIKDHFKLSLTL